MCSAAAVCYAGNGVNTGCLEGVVTHPSRKLTSVYDAMILSSASNHFPTSAASPALLLPGGWPHEGRHVWTEVGLLVEAVGSLGREFRNQIWESDWELDLGAGLGSQTWKPDLGLRPGRCISKVKTLYNYYLLQGQRLLYCPVGRESCTRFLLHPTVSIPMYCTPI